MVSDDTLRLQYFELFNRPLKDADLEAFKRLANVAGVDMEAGVSYLQIHNEILSYMDFVSESLYACKSQEEQHEVISIAYGKLRS